MILHVDMDAFFVSVELVRRPELRGRPVVVGGTGRRGVVAAASYEARSYGVFSAMPSTQAQRLCPDAVFLSGSYDLYTEVSQRVMAIFADVTPLVEPLSLDEAFLDVTGALRLHGTGATIAARIRETIWKQESLTCSVGIAPTKFLAKLASEEAKPKASRSGPVFGRGVFEVSPGTELDFLHPLPVKALWGVGAATQRRLSSLGIETVGDLAATPVESLVRSLGVASGRHLHSLANGIDERAVEPDRETKSISHEETFANDIFERDQLDAELVRQCDAVAQRLRNHQMSARTATLKVRYGNFDTLTRRTTAPQPFTTSSELLAMARQLLGALDVSLGVRLLGVGVANLGADEGQQLVLDLTHSDETSPAAADPSDGYIRADLVDAVRAKFGDSAIGPASATVDGRLRVKRRGEQQWGPNKSLDKSDDG